MLSEELKKSLIDKIASVEHPRELVVDVMFELQDHYGFLSDEALEEAALLLGMTPLEMEELATFYTFIFREPVENMSFMCATVSFAGWMDMNPFGIIFVRNWG